MRPEIQCNSRGRVVSPGYCLCDKGYDGVNCELQGSAPLRDYAEYAIVDIMDKYDPVSNPVWELIAISCESISISSHRCIGRSEGDHVFSWLDQRISGNLCKDWL